MTPKTTIPDFDGPLNLSALEDILGLGTLKVGALAQLNGAALGFDLFTPTADATYVLLIRAQNAASGAPTKTCIDVVVLTATGGWAPVKAIPTVVTLGAPGATTYTKNGSALKFAIADAGTWYVDVFVIPRFPG